LMRSSVVSALPMEQAKKQRTDSGSSLSQPNFLGNISQEINTNL
jgi:hypothetical protein